MKAKTHFSELVNRIKKNNSYKEIDYLLPIDNDGIAIASILHDRLSIPLLEFSKIEEYSNCGLLDIQRSKISIVDSLIGSGSTITILLMIAQVSTLPHIRLLY